MSWETIVTMPMPIMDSGIRPKNPAAEKPQGSGGGEDGAVGAGQGGLREGSGQQRVDGGSGKA